MNIYSNSSNLSMENSANLEADCAFGGLFQQIISEMKNTMPLFEDLSTKSTKLHSCLRATIQAVCAFLDAFQKIADAATSTKGATKDIGTALTRICLRHKAIEAKMKTFTSSILDCLIIPLQEKLEEWKRTSITLDKDHAKEYKRARSELKKRSIETLRLQKKLRKVGLNNGSMSGSFSGTLPRSHGSSIGGGSNNSDSLSGQFHGRPGGGNRDMNRILEVALRDTAEKRQAFEEAEKQAVRAALIEERSRFCLFVSYLKPVVDEEVAMLSELTHVQEAMLQLEKHTTDPFFLPPASEQVITDLGSCGNGVWSLQSTPASSPSSLGSRKSSMCSISSANSSSSSSAHSPSHNVQHRTVLHQGGGGGGNQSEGSNASSTASSNSSTPSSPYPPGAIPTTNATWPNIQDSLQFERAACAIMNERPHTISGGQGHQRTPLNVYLFQPPPSETSTSQQQGGPVYQSSSEIYGILGGRKCDAKPPVPKRCSSLERPQAASISASTVTNNSSTLSHPPKSSSKFSKDLRKEQQQQQANSKRVPNFIPVTPDMIVPQPVYVNMHELNQMTSAKMLRQQQQAEMDHLPPPPPELMQQQQQQAKVDGGLENNLKSEGSLASRGSSGYGSQNQIVVGEDSNSGGSGSGSSTLEGEDLIFEADLCYCLDVASSKSQNSEVQNYCTLPRKVKNVDQCQFVRTKGFSRTKSSQGHPAVGRQPGGGPSSGPGSRRNSCGNQEKPQPPVRRNSSISSSPCNSRSSSIPSSPAQLSNHQQQQQQALQSLSQMQSVSQNANSTYQQLSSSQGSMDSVETTPHASMEHLPPPPAYLMGLTQEQRDYLKSDDPALKRMSVAETIKTLTEKNHQPVSPNMVRRSSSLKQSDDKDYGRNNHGPRRKSDESTAKSRANIIQTLNQKLAAHHQPAYGNLGQGYSQPIQPIYQQQQFFAHSPPYQQPQQQHHSFPQQPGSHGVQQPIYQTVAAANNNTTNSNNSSPRHSSRRFSEELLKSTATFVQSQFGQRGTKTPPPVATSKELFVHTLNAKLSNAKIRTQSSPPTERKINSPTQKNTQSFASKLAASVGSHQKGNSVGDRELSAAFRVRQWISSKTVSDPTICRESLMEQIRRGTKLKQINSNDRSAPRIQN